MSSSTLPRTLLLTGLALALGVGLTGCGRSVTLGQSQGPASGGAPAATSSTSSGPDPSGAVSSGPDGVAVEGGGVKISAGVGGISIDAPGASVSGGAGGVSIDARATEGTSTIGSGDDRMEVSIGTVAADDATEQAAADVFARYWRLSWQAVHDVRVDVKQLTKVASGQAAGEVTRLTQDPSSHVLGQVATDVVDVTAAGNDAQLTACSTIAVKEVGTGGKVVNDLSGTYKQDVVLRRVGGSWKVTSYRTSSSATACG